MNPKAKTKTTVTVTMSEKHAEVLVALLGGVEVLSETLQGEAVIGLYSALAAELDWPERTFSDFFEGAVTCKRST